MAFVFSFPFSFNRVRRKKNPLHQISKYQNIWSYFDILALLLLIQYFDTLLVFWIFLLEISKICTQLRTVELVDNQSSAPGSGRHGGGAGGGWIAGLKDPIGERSDKSNCLFFFFLFFCRQQKSLKILPEFEKIC